MEDRHRKLTLPLYGTNKSKGKHKKDDLWLCCTRRVTCAAVGRGSKVVMAVSVYNTRPPRLPASLPLVHIKIVCASPLRPDKLLSPFLCTETFRSLVILFQLSKECIRSVCVRRVAKGLNDDDANHSWPLGSPAGFYISWRAETKVVSHVMDDCRRPRVAVVSLFPAARPFYLIRFFRALCAKVWESISILKRAHDAKRHLKQKIRLSTLFSLIICLKD